MHTMSQMNVINIAIDGPAGAGKSTVAKRLARQLRYVYIDTGAMYRAIAWNVIQHGIQGNEAQMIELAAKTNIELLPGEKQQTVIVNGIDVSEAIRTPEISNYTSKVATIGAIRETLVAMQKAMAAQKGVVMDGRDIGTHVLPDAELKVFLTASVEERAERRYRELLAKQESVSLEAIKADIAARDHQDETREISPLVKAEDARLLDSSALTIDEVVNLLLKWAQDATLAGER
jgi:cytidylate kinase